MIKAIIAIVTNIPIPNPALKTPSKTEQLVVKREVKITNDNKDILFFIVQYLKLVCKVCFFM